MSNMRNRGCGCADGGSVVRIVKGNDFTVVALASVYDEEKGLYIPFGLAEATDVELNIVGLYGKVSGKDVAVDGNSVIASFSGAIGVGPYGVEILFRDSEGKGRIFERNLFEVVATSGEATTGSTAEGETGDGHNVSVDVRTRTVRIGKSTGVTDYTLLDNKPSINGRLLEGNKTADELGFAKVATSNLYEDLDHHPTKLSYFTDDICVVPFLLDLSSCSVTISEEDGHKAYSLTSFGKEWGTSLLNRLRRKGPVWINYAAQTFTSSPRWAMICSCLYGRDEQTYFGFTNDGKWCEFKFYGLLTSPFSASLHIYERGALMDSAAAAKLGLIKTTGRGANVLADNGEYINLQEIENTLIDFFINGYAYDISQLFEKAEGDEVSEDEWNTYGAVVSARAPIYANHKGRGCPVEAVLSGADADIDMDFYLMMSGAEYCHYRVSNHGLSDSSHFAEVAEVESTVLQPILKSGTNIKSLNGNSLLGEGDVTILEPLCIKITDSTNKTLNYTVKEIYDAIRAGRPLILMPNNYSQLGIINTFATEYHGQYTVVLRCCYYTGSSRDDSPSVPDKVYFYAINGYASTNTYTLKEYTWYFSDLATIIDKQEKLISGTNIKTVNGQSLLGAGDIVTDKAVISPLPDVFSGTSAEFFANLKELYDAGTLKLNSIYYGNTEITDIVDGLLVQEMRVEVLPGDGGQVVFSAVATTSTYDDSLKPFRWETQSLNGGFSKWVGRATQDSIPTKLSRLSNDAGYAKADTLETITDASEITVTCESGRTYQGNNIMTLAIGCSASDDSQAVEERIIFSTGSSVESITVTGVSWANGDTPSFKGNKVYEINISFVPLLGRFLATYAEY